jgi:hypothetical protein
MFAIYPALFSFGLLDGLPHLVDALENVKKNQVKLLSS